MATERANFPAEMGGVKPYITCSPGKKLAALEEALPPSKRPSSGPAESPDSQRLALADCRLRAVDEPPPPAPASGLSASPAAIRRIQSFPRGLLPLKRALSTVVFTAYGPRHLRATQSPFSRRHRHFLMPHHCTTCRAPLQDADGHGECVGCLGKPHADDAFAGGSCSHCESMSLASLRSRAAFFPSDTDRALLSPSSREPARKRQRGRPVQRSELSELTSAQCPRASPSPSREQSPVLFSRPEQRPSSDASDFVSFGGLDDELPDDSVSLAAS
ncbi:hypothetical protein DPX16_6059 [Anabarilius grahami]|uniref:Uncharacterized protein n=1 Tax=Anabarilius grahami TaxID=495550 RepID=A0A3N0Z1P4_ANAGA|nr:hypothetical protein DPX16_6059 [Anabarilius grahami]